MIVHLYRRILPGHGLENDVVFGMSETQVQERVGGFDERWFNEEGNLMATIDDGQTMLSFDREDGFRLASIEVFCQPRLLLFGKLVFPQDRESFLDEIRNHGYSFSEEESGLIAIDSLSLLAFFEDEKLDAISFRVFFSEDGDEAIWPTASSATCESSDL